MTDRFETSNSSIRTTCSDLSETSRNVIINNRWLILGKIGEGSFGEVFEAQDIMDGKIYAIKRERKSMRHPQLKRESEHYQRLGHGPGVPQCHWYGEFDEFNCIVLDLLGPSLKDIRQCMTPMPFDIIVELICQMINIIQHVHQKGLVFRDIKPDNFLFSKECDIPQVKMVKLEQNQPHYQYEMAKARTVFDRWGKEKSQLYIIDLGLATHWRDPETDKPLPEAKPKRRNKIGTARYASINVHRGRMHARRDDLEGIAYILLDLILGTLPWTGIQARNSAMGWDRMRTMKQDAYMPELLDGYPEGLVKFVEYIRNLKFTQDPDYALLKQFLRGSLPGGTHAAPTRSPFEKGNNSEPRQRHRMAADMTPYFGHDLHNSGNDAPTTTITTKGAPGEENGPSSSDGSTAKKKWDLQEKRVGWYTYKHDEEPWEPEIDWDRNDGNQENTFTGFWGEDKPNSSWGPKDGKTTSTQGGSGWPSSVTRTDSGTGWDCMPSSSQETRGDSWGNKQDTTKMDVDAGWGANEFITNSWTVTTTTDNTITPSSNAWSQENARGGCSKQPNINTNEKDGWGTKPEQPASSNWTGPTELLSISSPQQQQQSLSAYNTRSRPQQHNHSKPSSSSNHPQHHNNNNKKQQQQQTTSGTNSWNAWAASHDERNIPSRTSNPSRTDTNRRQQRPPQAPSPSSAQQMTRSGSAGSHTDQGWNSQQNDTNAGWVSSSGKDGWTTKTSHHEHHHQRNSQHHRGRRNQHW
ncbi:kinase-like domain-containing protein [Phascolomyces articulosus]|uniref:Kinase-like domain-containing protein n=1 Tax=Phascolomyces articulosus TaxID=60185 RepID=A0AAD5KDJ3_9FUNG|nr:kinase-like domain-containing protein [Phascolomyces articulosus]